MRSPHSFLLAAVLVGSAPALAVSTPAHTAKPAAGTTSGAKAEGGAESVDRAWVKAMKANDLAAVVACYAKDAVLWLPDSPKSAGTNEIRGAYEALFGVFKVKDVVLTEAHYRTQGTLSTGWGSYTMTLESKGGGATVSSAGRFIRVAQKQGAHWLYVADQASAEPPAPTP